MPPRFLSLEAAAPIANPVPASLVGRIFTFKRPTTAKHYWLGLGAFTQSTVVRSQVTNHSAILTTEPFLSPELYLVKACVNIRERSETRISKTQFPGLGGS